MEAKRLQIGRERGFVQHRGHHLRSRRQTGLDIGWHVEPTLDRLLRHQSGGQHDCRVRGVGAGSDGCDGDRSMVQLFVLGADRDRHGAHVMRSVGTDLIFERPPERRFDIRE